MRPQEAFSAFAPGKRGTASSNAIDTANESSGEKLGAVQE